MAFVKEINQAHLSVPEDLQIPGVYAINPVAWRIERILSLIVVILPTIATVYAVWLLATQGKGFGAAEAWLLGVFYALTIIGIGVGYHRLFTHHAFQTPTPIRVILAVLGSMASQGPVLFWTAIHRRHHNYSDTPGDSHSPYFHKNKILNGVIGFWHSHTGWLFHHEITDWVRYIPDLLRDNAIFRVNQLYFLWVFLGLLIPTAIGGIAHHSWEGAFYGLLWGGLVRTFCVHHSTWCINSVCHIFGTQPFRSEDHARNNWIVAVLTFGEGWHNNHHAFPYAASHSFKWWQYDPNGWVIKILEACGLAWDIKKPSEKAIQAKQNEEAPSSQLG
jgi:stearoyl-CoA desaturase (Delta-9 desaturase)